MSRLKGISSIFLLIGIIVIVGAISFKKTVGENKENLKTNLSNVDNIILSDEIESFIIRDRMKNEEVIDSVEEEIIFKTKKEMTLKFIYNYIDEKKEEVVTQKISLFMIDKTIDEMDKIFLSWDIVEYGDDGITFTKEFKTEKNKYIVGIENDFVAIYIIEGENEKLIQITNTPVGTLQKKDREMLKTGIKVEDDYSLFKILEDYET